MCLYEVWMSTEEGTDERAAVVRESVSTTMRCAEERLGRPYTSRELFWLNHIAELTREAGGGWREQG